MSRALSRIGVLHARRTQADAVGGTRREKEKMLFRCFPLLVALSVFSTAPSYQQVKSDSEGNFVQRFRELWLITYIGENGTETIADAPAATGEMVPLIAADNDRLQSIIAAGKQIAATRHIKLRLVKFTERSDVGEFAPSTSP